ncbi:MAG: MinD/ParA family protein [Pseudomonadales bacterium]|nr:MinD/ParA family protein [Pseudomonadales bacterium]
MAVQSLNPVRVLAVTGGKGGVGKTNISVNIGIALAKMGRKVTLLDADLGLGNVDVLLGIKPRKTLQDVFNGDATLNDVSVPGPQGIRIVPAASGTQDITRLSPKEHAGLISAFSEISHQMDVLIIDTAAGISDVVTNFLRAAQEVMLVVCNEPTSITDAYALIKVLGQDFHMDHVRVLANMVRSDEEGRKLYEKLVRVAERFLDIRLDYVGYVPFDEHIRRAVQKQKAVIDLYPQAAASKAITKVAESVDGWPLPAKPSGHLQFFVEQLLTA